MTQPLTHLWSPSWVSVGEQLHCGQRVSGETLVTETLKRVTCDKCRKTDAFQRNHQRGIERLGYPPRKDTTGDGIAKAPTDG